MEERRRLALRASKGIHEASHWGRDNQKELNVSIEQGVAHFHVDSEFIMNIARNLWAEGASSKAVKMLLEGFAGITEGIALDILTGKKRLSGWDSKVKLLPDSATKDDRGLLLPKSLSEAFKSKEDAIVSAKKETQEIAMAA